MFGAELRVEFATANTAIFAVFLHQVVLGRHVFEQLSSSSGLSQRPVHRAPIETDGLTVQYLSWRSKKKN